MKKIKFELLVIILFVISRLPSLGHDNFTTDTWKWKGRSYDFGTGVFQLDFQKTLQKYHPGVTLMWLGTAGIKTYNLSYNLLHGTDPQDNTASTVFELDLVQKLFVVTAIAVALAFALYPLRILFGVLTASMVALLVSFEPYFLALSRVFHLEGLLSIFMLSSVVWLFWFLHTGERKKLLISALFGGLAILTKTTALFLLPFTLLMLMVWGFLGEGLVKNLVGVLSKNLKFFFSVKKIILNFLIWMVVVCVVIFSLWPALWVSPAGVYKAIYKGIVVVGIEDEHIQYYFGKLVSDPGPSFYPVVFVYKVSIFLIAGLIGLLFTAKKLPKDKRQFILFLFCYSLFYILAISLPTKKLDRYIVPAVLSLTVVSSFFYIWVWEKIKAKNLIKIPISVLVLLASVYYLHPDYLSYYNPLLGGLQNGINVLEPKWLIGEREVLSYFRNIQVSGVYKESVDSSIEGLIKNKQIGNVLVVAFQEKYYTQIWPFFREIGAWAVIEDLSGQSKYAQYFVYPVWDDTSSKETRFKLEYLDSIKVRGVEVHRVYKKI